MAKFDRRQERMKERIDARAGAPPRGPKAPKPSTRGSSPAYSGLAGIERLIRAMRDIPPEVALNSIDLPRAVFTYGDPFDPERILASYPAPEPVSDDGKVRTPNYYGHVYDWADVLKRSDRLVRNRLPETEPEILVADVGITQDWFSACEFEGLVVYRDGDEIVLAHVDKPCSCAMCCSSSIWMITRYRTGESTVAALRRLADNPHSLLSWQHYLDRVIDELLNPKPKTPEGWVPNVWLDERTGLWTSEFPSREIWEADIAERLRGLDLSEVANKLAEKLAS